MSSSNRPQLHIERWIVLRWKHRNAPEAGGFRVPFGPYVVPVLSILSCLYIMWDLSMLTFRVFFIWMAAALFVYFAYGLRHSRLNVTPRN